MKEIAPKECDYEEEEVIADVWVQLLIYLNIYFCGVWAIVTILYLYYEFANISDIEKILSILVLVVALPLEAVRLYLGFTGNLNSAIPSFAGYLILSSLIQLPLQVYLQTTSYTLKHLLPTVVQSIKTGTLVLQIGTGFPAMRRLSAFRRKQFQQQRWQYMAKKASTERSGRSTADVVA